jgi:glutamate formiminotransferase/glutamate formiminotransferase/formiminotetrahydrofolate cyclodeaminase
VTGVESLLLECVINVSEGRDPAAVAALAEAAGPFLLDLHSDWHHHRSVLTLAGPGGSLQEAVQAVAARTVASLDIRQHGGAHPRLGTLDVVPWVSLRCCPVANGPIQDAIQVRDRFARWAGHTLCLPCFLYGPERSLPDLRRQAWRRLGPDFGPVLPHPAAGAAAVGARAILVAYNLWLAEPDLKTAREIATAIRGPEVRALAFAIGEQVQVSCNLIDPWAVGPAAVFDAVARHAEIARSELVGLAPQAVLDGVPRHRWQELDLDPATTIEARLEQAGLDGGSSATRRG